MQSTTNLPSVFITGASSGIGAALARYYADAGYAVSLAGRDQDRLDAVASQLGTPATLTHVVDVCDLTTLKNAGTLHMLRFGTLPEIVIACAGISHGTLTEDEDDLRVARHILETNLLGMMHTFAPFIPALRERQRGTLVGITSVAGLRGMPGAGAYCASKAGADIYLESLRLELRGSGIRVVTIAPGYVDTPMTAHNPFPMPFLMSPEAAARKIAHAIARGTPYVILPWPMRLAGMLLRLLPPALFDRMFCRVGRKPRATPPATP